MSALIKSGGGGAVRAFAVHGDVPRPAAPEPVRADPAEAERAALRAEIARLTRALAEAEAAADDAVLEAHAKGRREGLAAAEAHEDDRLAALRDGLDAAVAAFAGRLELLDGLAPQLARAALAKLFAEPGDWAAMTEAALARQLGQLRRASVVAIRVSPEDFADPAGLATLAGGQASIACDSDLRAGACRIECRLGQIDLDVREQWSALAGLLDRMGAEA